ncbi:hypothetical protein ARMSODRAFT_1010211 [Armillaria solidipes]|uniref:Peptidase C14 caspase domain-containing protein n=1 Tax=Armillaria solidipes TaxID=1076256 RepID=A0A2H3B374_9AGAR|nr:hypothetical protein ARMSODRAFT_1010211 [Armillaria solidipes]
MSVPSTLSLDSQICIRGRGAYRLPLHDYADSSYVYLSSSTKKPYYWQRNFFVSTHLPSNDCRMSVANQHHDHSGSGYLPDSPCSELPPDTQSKSRTIQSAHSDHIRHSDSSGRKRALCIGINYRDKSNELQELQGCIKDAGDMHDFLMRHKYENKDIKMLTDEIGSVTPTKENILDALSWLIKGARSDDSLFIHYSGHGSQIVDTDGDEVDGKDEGFPIESFYPMNNLLKVHTLAVIECIGPSSISDDEIREILKSLPSDCRLTALFDSCHSGTVLDLSYVYDCRGQRERAVTPLVLDSISADVICWSGAKDDQKGADTSQGGVMTRAFIKAFEEKPNQSYKQLLHSIRMSIDYKYYNQIPQLGSSRKIDPDMEFTF